ncbi:MAG: hypothetical protein OEZ16_06135 [Chromatiales bacterium]|nr:hypothetical protein [Chromatiales bacterium]
MSTPSFRLPEQHFPGSDSFDTRASAVRRWVEQLPVGHTGKTAQHIYEMLYEVNRLQLSASERFELLMLVEPVSISILDNLTRHYTGMSFPLQAKSIRVAQFSNRLLQELITAYHATLESEESSSWLFRMTHNHMWAASIHRLIYFLNRLLCNYRHIHRPAPAGLWQAIHKLYISARNHGRLDEIVSRPDGSESTIDDEYKRALLLSMIEPHLFRPSQNVELQATMSYWVGLVKLLDSKHRPDGLMSYCIRVDHDEPHTILTDSCCDACDHNQVGFLLDMSLINQTIIRHIERMGNDDGVYLEGGVYTISRETLETLLLCWRLPDAIRHERVRKEHVVEIAIGMSVVHALLHGKAGASAQGINDQNISESYQSLSIATEDAKDASQLWQKQALREEQGYDVWDSIFYATEVTPKSWVTECKQRDAKFITALQTNYNDNGYGILIERTLNDPVQVGELIGYRASPHASVELCVVRWLRESNKAITLGLKRLAATVEAVLVRIDTGDQKTSLYCLLGIGEDQIPLLFIPYLPNIRKKKIYLAVDKKEVPILLHDKVTLSPLFEAYHFATAAVTQNTINTEERACH